LASQKNPKGSTSPEIAGYQKKIIKGFYEPTHSLLLCLLHGTRSLWLFLRHASETTKAEALGLKEGLDGGAGISA